MKEIKFNVTGIHRNGGDSIEVAITYDHSEFTNPTRQIAVYFSDREYPYMFDPKGLTNGIMCLCDNEEIA